MSFSLRQLCAAAGVVVLSGAVAVADDGDVAIYIPKSADVILEHLSSVVQRDSIYKQCCISVAQVEKTTAMGVSTSSGFFLDKVGTLATVLPTNDERDTFRVQIEGVYQAAKLLAVDKTTRLALLKVEGIVTRPLELSRGVDLSIGDYLHCVAESDKPLNRMVMGRLVARERDFNGRMLPTTILRMNMKLDDAAESVPSECFGAPVVDKNGRASAVLLLDLSSERETCYALPSEVVHKVWRDYRKFGKVEPAWCGFSLEPGTTTPRIHFVRDESPAAKAGLKPGDIVVRVGDRMVKDYQDVADAIYYLPVGESVDVHVMRGVRDFVAKVTPGKFPTAKVPGPKSTLKVE